MKNKLLMSIILMLIFLINAVAVISASDSLASAYYFGNSYSSPTSQELLFDSLFGSGYCGDGDCSGSENALNCPADCADDNYCGDGDCSGSENALNCPADCAPDDYCGDGDCSGSENALNCPADCAPDDYCGDGTCDSDETALSCPADCAPDHYCGDGTCDSDETALSCPEDCGEPVYEPVFSVSPNSLYFDIDTTELELTVKNEGNGTINWSATHSEDWLSINKYSGSLPCGTSASPDSDIITVSVDRTKADNYENTDTIEFTSNGGDATVAVTMIKGECTPGETESQQCGETDVGVCEYGTQNRTCQEDGTWGEWSECEGAVYPSTETCNALDDDCDGDIDENLTQQCGVSNVGICTYGTETCDMGVWTGCDAIFPQEEEPNGLDDDCDGSIDEDFDCMPGETETQQCGYSDVGACEMGYQIRECTSTGFWSSWGSCIGAVYPSREVMNGIDDDCDGEIDEGLYDFGNGVYFSKVEVYPIVGGRITPGSTVVVKPHLTSKSASTYNDVEAVAYLYGAGSRSIKTKFDIRKNKDNSVTLLLDIPYWIEPGHYWIQVSVYHENFRKVKFVPVKVE